MSLDCDALFAQTPTEVGLKSTIHDLLGSITQLIIGE